MHWTLQSQTYSIYVLLVSMSLKLRSVSLYDQPFSRYRSFWQVNTTRSNVPHTCIWITTVPESQISLHFALRPAAFSNHKGQMHRMTPKWPRILQGQMYPHICGTSIHLSHISPRFDLRPAVLDLQTILRKVHQNDPKLTLNPTRSNYPILCVNYCPRVLNFTRFHFTTSPF